MQAKFINNQGLTEFIDLEIAFREVGMAAVHYAWLREAALGAPDWGGGREKGENAHESMIAASERVRDLSCDGFQNLLCEPELPDRAPDDRDAALKRLLFDPAYQGSFKGRQSLRVDLARLVSAAERCRLAILRDGEFDLARELETYIDFAIAFTEMNREKFD